MLNQFYFTYQDKEAKELAVVKINFTKIPCMTSLTETLSAVMVKLN